MSSTRSLTLLRPTQRLLEQHTRRLLSTTSSLSAAPSKKKPTNANGAIELEQPDKFRPPSHPARLRRKRPRMVYGRELSEEDKQELDGKQYPYMMPPKDTLLHRFLTAKRFHLVFALSVLTALTIWINVLEFKRKNRFPDLLPHGSLFFRSPVSFIQQYLQVYKLNNEEDSRDYKAKREYELGDVERRRQFREAHDIPEVTGVAAWLGLGTVEEEMRLRKKKEEQERLERERKAKEEAGLSELSESELQKPKRKVFFGIWG